MAAPPDTCCLPALFAAANAGRNFSYGFAQVSRLLHTLFAKSSRKRGNIPTPDAPTMETVAGIGSLMAGMWISRKPSASRNGMLAALAAAGGLLIRLERQTGQDRSLRQKESVALGSIVGGVILGGLLGFIAYFRNKLAVAPANQPLKRTTPALTISSEGRGDSEIVYAPVAQTLQLDAEILFYLGRITLLLPN